MDANEELREAAEMVVMIRRDCTANLGNTIPLKLAQAIDALARQVGVAPGPAELKPAEKWEYRAGCTCVHCRSGGRH
jgi:hypothetical protein